MPTERAVRAAKAVLFKECGYSEHQFERWTEGLPFIHRVANEIDLEASLPALEAVAKAAVALEKEWARLGYGGPLTANLRAAIADLEEKP